IVAEGKNLQDFGVAHQRFEYVHPISQVASAVDDGFIPCRCLLLNPLAVSKPANISEVRCNQIELSFISQGRGTNDVSVSAKATVCSRSTSTKLASSQVLFRISITNL